MRKVLYYCGQRKAGDYWYGPDIATISLIEPCEVLIYILSCHTQVIVKVVKLIQLLSGHAHRVLLMDELKIEKTTCHSRVSCKVFNYRGIGTSLDKTYLAYCSPSMTLSHCTSAWIQSLMWAVGLELKYRKSLGLAQGAVKEYMSPWELSRDPQLP